MKKYLPFGRQYAPDQSRFGDGEIRGINNLLPIHGSFRPVSGGSTVSTGDSGTTAASYSPINGAHQHIYSADESVQYGRPDADLVDGDWRLSDSVSQTDLWDYVDGDAPNDAQFIKVANFGTFLDFDGATSYGSGGNVLDIDDTTSFTGRIRFRTNDSSVTFLGKRAGASSTQAGYLLFVTAGGAIFFEVCDGTSEVSVSSASGFNDGEWHEAFYRLDRSADTIDLNVDGTWTSTADISSIGSLSNAENFYIGRGGSTFYEGELDEGAFWSGTALSNAQVAARLTVPLDDGDATSYWRMNDGSGGTAADNEGANDLTLTATSWLKASVARIKLSDFATPSSTTGWNFRARYRVTNPSAGAWSLAYRILNDAGTTERKASATIESDTSAGTGDWKNYVQSFTGDLAWTDNTIELTASVTDTDTDFRATSEDNSDNWVDENGGTTDIYDSIDDSSPSDSTYVRSGVVSPTGSTTYTVDIAATDPQAYFNFGRQLVKFRYKKPQSGNYLEVKLLQDETEIASNTYTTDAVAAFTDGVLSLSASELNSITDWSDLKVQFVNHGGTPGTLVTDTWTAAADVGSSGGWAAAGGASTFWEAVEADDTKYAENALGAYSGSEYFQVDGAGDFVATGNDASAHTVAIQWSNNDSLSTNRQITAAIMGGGTEIASEGFINVPEADINDSFTLTTGEVDTLKNKDVGFKVSGGRDLEVDYIWLTAPTPNYVYISDCYLDVPGAGRAEVSWMELEAPIANAQELDDQPTLYAGNKTDLFTVATSGWTDVSGTTYGGTGTNPHPWMFAQWGNDMIATNGTDPVQIRSDGTGNFANMMTSTEKPTARYVAVVRNQVWTGNCGGGTGTPDMVWWSALDDAADFDPSIETQSDYQRLRDTPGQITGLVGGEYAVIFKRTSIYRAEYEGLPNIYRFYLLSSNVGTPYSRSIVPVGRDIYFHSGSDFMVLRDGMDKPESIGAGFVSREISDQLSSVGMHPASATDFLIEDNSLFGTYDPHSELIWWTYRNSTFTNTTYGVDLHRSAAIYNTKDGRWSRFSSSGITGCSASCSLFNYDYAATNSTRGIAFFTGITAAQAGESGSNIWHSHFMRTGNSTLTSEIESGIYSLAQGRDSTVKRIRPIFSMENAADTTTFTVTQTAGQTPLLDYSGTDVTFSGPDDDGWYFGRATGEFHKTKIDIPSLDTKRVREIVGVDVEYAVDGER